MRSSAHVHDPRAGLFGPGSKTWEIARESVIMLGGGRAALLQAAHPYVAHAVSQHSAVMQDVAGRFQRTFLHVFNMTFGTHQDAVTAARRVHRIHTSIRGRIRDSSGPFEAGHRYNALEPEALFWVGATLWETSVKMYELLVRPLSSPEKNLYLLEAKRFGSMFGIPDELFPDDWRTFEDYNAKMWASDTLTVTAPAMEICTHIFRAPIPVVAPMYSALRAFTAWSMPARLRDDFGLTCGPREDAIARSLVRSVSASLPLMPGAVRYFPAYLDAQRRLRGAPGRHPVGFALETLLLRALGGGS